MRFRAVALTAVLALSGCAAGWSGAANQASNWTMGRTVSPVAGGGLVAHAGVELGRRAHAAAVEAEYRALETTPAGEPVRWRDDRSGHSGTVTAAQPYRVGSQDCRPYTHVVSADGSAQSVRGTACRNADGSWTLLN